MNRSRIVMAFGVVVLVAGLVAIWWSMSSPSDDGPSASGTHRTPSPSPSPSQSVRTPGAPSGKPGVGTPAPTGKPGVITQEVPSGKPVPTTRAPLDDRVRLSDGVRVRVLRTRNADVKPGGPGEAGGPAVVASIEIDNRSQRQLGLDTVMVTLLYRSAGGEMVAQPLTGDPARPFSGQLRSGDVARATYVFRVPGKSRAAFAMLFQYAAGTDAVRFERNM